MFIKTLTPRPQRLCGAISIPDSRESLKTHSILFHHFKSVERSYGYSGAAVKNKLTQFDHMRYMP